MAGKEISLILKAHGRQLASMSKTGMSIVFGYDADGQRISKAVTEGGVTTTTAYYYRDGKLIDAITGDDRVHIFYDGNGSPVAMIYNGTRYFYVRNAQGDIVGLTNNTGTGVVSYSYDAWGKILSVTGSKANTIGKINPLRYRGYVYDTETGLYYLGSRYYDPGVGRFISADEYVTTQQGFSGCCLFVYCNNNPTNCFDLEGRWTWGISFGGIASFITGIYGSVGLYIDDNWNIDLQLSYSVPLVDPDTGFLGYYGAGYGIAIQRTEADSVDDLLGSGQIIGGSGNFGKYSIGLDAVFLGDSRSLQKKPDGFQLTVGKGTGLDYHVIKTKTISIRSMVSVVEESLSEIERRKSVVDRLYSKYRQTEPMD